MRDESGLPDYLSKLLEERGEPFAWPHERVAERLIRAAGGTVTGDPAALPGLINSLGVVDEIDSILDETRENAAAARAVAHLLQYPDGIKHRSLTLRYARIDMLLDEHEEDPHWLQASLCEPYRIAAVNLLKERSAPVAHSWPGEAPLLIQALPIALVLAGIMIRASNDGDHDMPELHLRLERHADLVRVTEDNPEQAYRIAEFVIANGLDAVRARAVIEQDIPVPLADGWL